MAETVRGGTARPIEPGIIARLGQRLKGTIDVWFGPLEPQQLSTPAGMPPRRFDYPSGANLTIQPRNYDSISFQQMRDVADAFDLVRIAIETRKDQVSKAQWSFRLKKETAESKKKFSERTKSDPRIEELNKFFRSPDGEHDWDEWLRMVLEDLLVVDAVSLAATIDDEGTLCAEKFESKRQEIQRFEVIDGATIKRVIDENGRTVAPPGIAYQQILKGVPAVDLSSDQLIYRPRNIRAHKFYGYSPVEQIIITINMALRQQMFTLAYFTDGNVPEAICQAPETWNADSIKEFQDWFDSLLAGNLQQRRRINFIPYAGGKDAIQFTKEPPLKTDLHEWLARVVCWAFSLPPTALIKQLNRASAQQQQETADEEGVTPTLHWLANLINSLVRKYWGYDDVEFAWNQDQAQDEDKQSQIYDRALRNGTLTIDEVRELIGEEPVGLTRNLVYTASGVTPIDSAIEQADNPASAPEAGQRDDLPGHEGEGGNVPQQGVPPKPGSKTKLAKEVEENIWRRLRKRVY